MIVDSLEDVPEDSPFLEAVKQMKEKKYENIVDLCTQQIEKGNVDENNSYHYIMKLKFVMTLHHHGIFGSQSVLS